MISQVINKIIDNDIGYSFVKSKIAIISTIVFLIILICSTFAELIAPTIEKIKPNPIISKIVATNIKQKSNDKDFF